MLVGAFLSARHGMWSSGSAPAPSWADGGSDRRDGRADGRLPDSRSAGSNRASWPTGGGRLTTGGGTWWPESRACPPPPPPPGEGGWGAGGGGGRGGGA